MVKDWQSELISIVGKLIAKKESEVFREPVPHQELGLVDYLTIIKNKPMDLGTVKSKLQRGEYTKEAANANTRPYFGYKSCITDIRQIWLNAMVYNASESVVYQNAQQLSILFESMLLKFSTSKNDGHSDLEAVLLEAPPTSEMMSMWCTLCSKITPDQLAAVLKILDDECPFCLVKDSEHGEIEVNTDLITGKAYSKSMEYLQKLVK